MAVEAEDLIPQADSDNSDESRDHIITNSAVIPVLICQTVYSSPTIVHSLEKKFPEKYRYNKNNLARLEKGNLKMTGRGSHYKPVSSSGTR